jgi:hypothetical protein
VVGRVDGESEGLGGWGGGGNGGRGEGEAGEVFRDVPVGATVVAGVALGDVDAADALE